MPVVGREILILQTWGSMEIEKAKTKAFYQSLNQLQTARGLTNVSQRKAALKEYYFPNSCATYEYASVYINWIIAAYFAVAIGGALLTDPPSLFLLIGAIAAGFFVADVMSAFFHKWLDSYASEAHPLWGSSAKAFRIHHEFLNNLNKTTYMHNVAAFGPFSLFLNALFFLATISFLTAPVAQLMVYIMILLFTNGTEIHKQAHRKKHSFLVSWMQRLGFFLNSHRHLKHHTSCHNSDYGIINGWSNNVLNKLKVWQLLDLGVWQVFGLFPRNWIHTPASIPPSIVKELAQKPELIPLEISLYLAAFPQKRAQIEDFLPVLPACKKPS